MTYYDVVIIGAGQAGIVMGYYLKQTGISFVMVDAESRVGNSWRNRYDSLVLFTQRNYSSLPGLKMGGAPKGFPTKDEMAHYLEVYVKHFQLPIKLNTTVKQVKKYERAFEIVTNQGKLKSDQVVVATGAFQKPFIPPIINEEDNNIIQLHSSEYKAPRQLKGNSIVVIGGGNSGAQIACELASDRKVTLAISNSFNFLPLTFLGKSIFKWLDITGLLYAGIDTKRGNWFKKRNDPIFGYELKQLINKGKIEIKPEAIRVEGNNVTFKDKSKVFYDAIIWATGYTPSYDWIKIKGAMTTDGSPIHTRGLSVIKGLYFIGLPWQYQRGSALICGVSRDADFLTPFILSYP